MSTRMAIMDIAAEAVRKRGYNGVSLDQIARDVGIQKSSIYYHFSSKSELIAAIFRRFSGQIYSFLEDTISAESRAGDRLLAYIVETGTFTQEGESICMSIALNIDRDSLQAEVVNDLVTFHAANIAWLTDTFALGLKDGSISDVGDPAEEANACLALVDGAQLMARAHQDPGLYEQATMLLRSRISASGADDSAR
ncbi:TetR/AcrR family transcriptional regulator [uncultured Parasphingorhabdus sp.]|uniref:TetR/AcrR family transcriptional regulator n=1 Tax=uncultured Parasphingorhabdus sp. TaxID=2709694 RepID=UPI002AA7ECCB|nr:TetR/AcrR family transcriptional regulator [uncultured Parasphingorhabdus sp.]